MDLGEAELKGGLQAPLWTSLLHPRMAHRT